MATCIKAGTNRFRCKATSTTTKSCVTWSAIRYVPNWWSGPSNGGGAACGAAQGTADERALLADGPLPLPARWVQHVNRAQHEGELQAIRRSVQRGQPYGKEPWIATTAGRLGLESTLRPRGRPKRDPADDAPSARG